MSTTNLEMHFDVVIIGCGPAGTAAAYTLVNEKDLSICIIDKCSFPREKVCGGLLTKKSKKTFEKIFNASWSKAYESKSTNVNFFYKTKLLNKVEDYDGLYFTSRLKFDQYLLSLARIKGLNTITGDKVIRIDLSLNKCYLSSGKIITYDYLIGADGANSMVSRELFGKAYVLGKTAYGLEIEVKRDSNFICNIVNPQIHFGVINWGYGWVFPTKDSIKIGFAGIINKNKDISNNFKKFCFSIIGSDKKVKIKGHLVPFGYFRKNPGFNNVLLAGDAAGFVDPITGEGIAYAMQSGYYAGSAIIDYKKNKKNSLLKIYKKKLSNIFNSLRIASYLRLLIYPKFCQTLFYMIFPLTKKVPLKYMDLLSGKTNYMDFLFFLNRAFLKRMFKFNVFSKKKKELFKKYNLISLMIESIQVKQAYKPFVASLFFGLITTGYYILFIFFRREYLFHDFETIALVFFATIWLWVGPLFIWRFDFVSVPRFLEASKKVIINEIDYLKLCKLTDSKVQLNIKWRLFLVLWVLIIFYAFVNSYEFIKGFGVLSSNELWWYMKIFGIICLSYMTGLGFLLLARSYALVFKFFQLKTHIDPYNIDKRGGFLFLGKFCSETSLMFFSGILFLPILLKTFLFHSNLPAYLMLLIQSFYIFGIFVSFILPLYFFQSKVKNEKKNALINKISEIYFLKSQVKKWSSCEFYQYFILKDEYADIEKIITIPFNFASFFSVTVQLVFSVLLAVFQSASMK